MTQKKKSEEIGVKVRNIAQHKDLSYTTTPREEGLTERSYRGKGSTQIPL